MLRGVKRREVSMDLSADGNLDFLGNWTLCMPGMCTDWQGMCGDRGIIAGYVREDQSKYAMFSGDENIHPCLLSGMFGDIDIHGKYM